MTPLRASCPSSSRPSSVRPLSGRASCSPSASLSAQSKVTPRRQPLPGGRTPLPGSKDDRRRSDVVSRLRPCASSPALKWNDSFDGTASNFGETPRWDVMGLGQAIVDFSASVSEDFLEGCGVDKGGRKVISVDERGEVLTDLDGRAYKVNAGGSLSNTLVALARLGSADAQLRNVAPLRVCLGGSIGADRLGEFYTTKINKAGVAFISQPQPQSATGTVVVLTTPDAQRSFLSYPGTAHDITADAEALKSISDCRALMVEGYLWEMPGAMDGILHAIKAARLAGSFVVMTAGDPGVVKRHRSSMLAALEAGVDVMFTNVQEAAALIGIPDCSAKEAALMLATRAKLTVVTDGSRGAYIAALGTVHKVEPHWATDRPVDTCGAGDAFAAGVMYGLLKGYDIPTVGKFGARVASAVISRYGARLKKNDALLLAQEMADHCRHGAALPPSDDHDAKPDPAKIDMPLNHKFQSAVPSLTPSPHI